MAEDAVGGATGGFVVVLEEDDAVEALHRGVTGLGLERVGSGVDEEAELGDAASDAGLSCPAGELEH